MEEDNLNTRVKEIEFIYNEKAHTIIHTMIQVGAVLVLTAIVYLLLIGFVDGLKVIC